MPINQILSPVSLLPLASGCTHGLGHNEMDISIFSIYAIIYISVYLLFIIISVSMHILVHLHLYLYFCVSLHLDLYLHIYLCTVGQTFLLKSLWNTENDCLQGTTEI